MRITDADRDKLIAGVDMTRLHIARLRASVDEIRGELILLDLQLITLGELVRSVQSDT